MASTQTPERAALPEPGEAAHDAPLADAGARPLLLFTAAGRLFGCELTTVREIVPYRRCTRLPGSPDFVCGLTNLRGTVITVVDLSRRLAAGHAPEWRGRAAAARTEGSIIVAEYGAKVVGLAVDGVRDVQGLADDRTTDDAADAAAAVDGAVVRGLGRLGDEMVIVLDVQTILRQVLA